MSEEYMHRLLNSVQSMKTLRELDELEGWYRGNAVKWTTPAEQSHFFQAYAEARDRLAPPNSSHEELTPESLAMSAIIAAYTSMDPGNLAIVEMQYGAKAIVEKTRMRELFDELAALRPRLREAEERLRLAEAVWPHTADGGVVLPGGEFWWLDGCGDVTAHRAHSFTWDKHGGWWVGGMDLKQCYATRDAALASQERS